jgi:phosphate:Na+ symporter
LLAATGDIESMSAAITRELAPLAQSLKAAESAPSKETTDLLHRLQLTVQETAQFALRALVERDQQAAQVVVARRVEILDLSADLQRQQAARLAQNDPNGLTRHRVQLEMIDKLRRIYSVSEHMAISVLPRSVLVGELYS